VLEGQHVQSWGVDDVVLSGDADEPSLVQLIERELDPLARLTGQPDDGVEVGASAREGALL
jgi:hypothetical protein